MRYALTWPSLLASVALHGAVIGAACYSILGESDANLLPIVYEVSLTKLHSAPGKGVGALQASKSTVPLRHSSQNRPTKAAQPPALNHNITQLADSPDEQERHTSSDSPNEPVAKLAPLGSEGSGGIDGQGAVGVYAPQPPFPAAARRVGFSGITLLEVAVDVDGKPSAVKIVASSGRDDCDQSAYATVLKRWRFSPATVRGLPVPSKMKVAIEFAMR